MEARPESITVKIICPLMRAPNSFTFHNLPLSSTVEELQRRITDTLPNHPPPETQKLIARGKYLSNGKTTTLRDALSPIDASQLTMHLMLPESLTTSGNTSTHQPSSQPPTAINRAAPQPVFASSSASSSQPPPSNLMSTQANQSPPPLHESVSNLASEIRALRNRIVQSHPLENGASTSQSASQPGDLFIVYGGRNDGDNHGVLIGPDSVLINPIFAYNPHVSSNERAQVNVAQHLHANAPLNPARVQQNAVNPRPNDPLRGPAAIIFRYLWQFIRIFFFIYLFSEPDTWTRTILLFGALLFVMLSETEIFTTIHDLVIAPVRRYLEGLANIGGSNQQEVNNNHNGAPYFRRVQQELFAFCRAFLLLLTSLVPGIGERQVEARVVAENERQAQEEERTRAREREQEQAVNVAEGQQAIPNEASDQVPALSNGVSEHVDTAAS